MQEAEQVVQQSPAPHLSLMHPRWDSTSLLKRERDLLASYEILSSQSWTETLFFFVLDGNSVFFFVLDGNNIFFLPAKINTLRKLIHNQFKRTFLIFIIISNVPFMLSVKNKDNIVHRVAAVLSCC